MTQCASRSCWPRTRPLGLRAIRSWTHWWKLRTNSSAQEKTVSRSLSLQQLPSLSKVAAVNPEHLFDQARELIGPPPAGPPRQANLRRAISASYYAVFHAAVTAASDLFVGAVNRATSRYALVYRSIDHKRLRELCDDITKPTLPAKYASYAPQNGFGADIVAFATALVDLQEKRHLADYDPLFRATSSDALLVLRTAEAALERLRNANSAARDAFLTLLVFRPRA